MKNTLKLIPVILLTLSATAFANDASFRELICETEGKWTQRENEIFRDSLIWNKIDNYANIAPFVEPLQVKSREVVKKNCLAGKHYKEVAPEISKIWKDGCAKIANPVLHSSCIKFLPLNDGSNIEKMIKENPSLAELIKRAKNSGSVEECSPEVSTSSVDKENELKDSLKKEKQSQYSKQ